MEIQISCEIILMNQTVSTELFCIEAKNQLMIEYPK